MLHDVKSGKSRLTREQLDRYRKAAAENGLVVEQVENAGEALGAALSAIPNNLAEDMLQFLETGSSPMTSASTPEELEALWSEAPSTT